MYIIRNLKLYMIVKCRVWATILIYMYMFIYIAIYSINQPLWLLLGGMINHNFISTVKYQFHKLLTTYYIHHI